MSEAEQFQPILEPPSIIGLRNRTPQRVGYVFSNALDNRECGTHSFGPVMGTGPVLP